MFLLRSFARSAFASSFLTGGYDSLRNPGQRPARVSSTLGLPEPELMVRANGALMMALGGALALGIKPRLAAVGLAGVLVPTTYVGHQFWAEDSEQSKRVQRIHFFKNLSLFGGLLAYAFSDD